MSAKSIIYFIAVMLMVTSCGNAVGDKPGRKMLIPDDKMVEILTDTYLTASMMDLLSMRDTWAQRDSILNYIDVIKSHGYTYEQFDATLKYYFTSKPKRLSRIYDKVTGNLLKLETVAMAENVPVEMPEENLWTGKASYSFPEDFTRDPLWFDIPADEPGEYKLYADIRVFEDDRSLNPRVTVYFSYLDSAGTEKRDYWKEVKLTKDGQFQKVLIRHTLDSIPGARVRGWLMNHDNQPGKWEKHARVANINLSVEKSGVPDQK
jgi:hypothetical protein